MSYRVILFDIGLCLTVFSGRHACVLPEKAGKIELIRETAQITDILHGIDGHLQQEFLGLLKPSGTEKGHGRDTKLIPKVAAKIVTVITQRLGDLHHIQLRIGDVFQNIFPNTAGKGASGTVCDQITD